MLINLCIVPIIPRFMIETKAQEEYFKKIPTTVVLKTQKNSTQFLIYCSGIFPEYLSLVNGGK